MWAPSVAVKLAGGAAATKTAAIPLHIDFTDNLAGPFPANFVCVQYGTPNGGLCDGNQGYTYNERAACSTPLTNGRTTNALGLVYLVIIVAASLAAIPLMIATGAGG